MIQLTRLYRLPAAHVLRHPALSEDENVAIYGKCANANGHGHDYGLEVTVSGPLDPLSGHIVDPDRLDAVVGERVIDRFSHRLLNDDAAFRDRVPTAENLVSVVREELEGALASVGGARVVRIRVLETRRNAFECGDPR